MWCIQRGTLLHTRRWDDGTVVFDEVSGNLQCLSPIAGQLLGFLIALGVCSTHELAHQLIGERPESEDEKLVENALIALASSNLIERVPV